MILYFLMNLKVVGLRLLYLVLDGAADELNGETPLKVAETPALDKLATKAKCGVQYSIGKGYAPESDVAVLSILGYNPHEHYTGRGVLEALGTGIPLQREGYEVAFRANFATIRKDEKTLEIIDRRCGRDLSSEEAVELAESLDGMDLADDAYARVKASVGHRGVVVLGSNYQLSDNVGNTDPAYVRIGKISTAAEKFEHKITHCKPLDNSSEAARTADLVNIFTKRSIEILKNHLANQKRATLGKLEANAMLLRDAGAELPKVTPINELYNASFAAVTEMPVEEGIARLLGMNVAEVPPPSKDKIADLNQRIDVTNELLEKEDVVYIHLKGPDEPGHDGNFQGKVESIELIDKYFVTKLLEHDLTKLAILVTSDHATPWKLEAHSDDPIPFMLASQNLVADGITKFCERECMKGSLGVLEHGWQLLPLVAKLIKL